MVINENITRKIIPIAGGKGGVGKSVVCANLGLALARAGKRTLLVDLDLGGANLHTLLGLKNTQPGIGSLISQGARVKLDSLVKKTPYPNLMFIPGDTLIPDTAAASAAQKKKIIDGLLQFDTEYILVDLGAGSGHLVIDFFLISNSGCIVTTPQHTAILNSFSFLKSTAYRFLRRVFASDKRVDKIFTKAARGKTPGCNKTIGELLRVVAKEVDPKIAEKASRCLAILRPHVIFNMIDHPEELCMAEGLRDLCKKNLRLNLACLGVLFRDSSVEESLKNRSPFLIQYPDSLLAREIEHIAQKILQSEHFPEMPLELSSYKDSFELARIEAEYDYPSFAESDPNGEYPNNQQLVDLLAKQQQKIHSLEQTVKRLTLGREALSIG